jgi:hypothetical protein
MLFRGESAGAEEIPAPVADTHVRDRLRIMQATCSDVPDDLLNRLDVVVRDGGVLRKSAGSNESGIPKWPEPALPANVAVADNILQISLPSRFVKPARHESRS